MNKETREGQWFLPGNELKLSGQLNIDYKRNKVELVTRGNNYIEGLQIKLSDHSIEQKYSHSIILGETSFENISLINCQWEGTNFLGGDLFEIRYVASIVLFDIHLSKTEDLQINRAVFKFPFLSSWYDGEKSLFKVDSFGKEPLSSVKDVVEVTDSLTFTFIDEYHKKVKEIGVSYEVDFQKRLEFKYTKYVSFDQLLSDATKFSKLIELTLGKKVEYQIQSIGVNSNLTEERNQSKIKSDQLYISVIYFGSYSNRNALEKNYVSQNFSLISGWILSREELNLVIRKWFSNIEYFHIYDYYLDSNNWFEGTGAVLTNVMFNNRFLNLIQALESFQKKTDAVYKRDINEFNVIKNRIFEFLKSEPCLANWIDDNVKLPENLTLKERLQDLVLKIAPIIKSLFRNTELFSDFPKMAKDYRHMLSHGNLEGTDLGTPLIVLFHQAQFILLLLILQTLGFNNQETIKLVKHDQNCVRRINEIIGWSTKNTQV
jgi:ApeA N-terminal domain 1